MAWKINSEKKLSVSKAAVKQRITDSEKRQRNQVARRRNIRRGLFLLFGVFVALIVMGVKKRSAWYVAHIEPIVVKVKGLSRSGNSADTSLKDDLPAAAKVSASRWFTNSEPSTDSPRQLSGYPEYRPPNLPAHVSSPPPAAVKPVLNKSTRPRPADLDFYSLKPQVRRHVLSQPPSLQELEGERVTILASARHHLILLMRYVPYETDPNGLRLKTGNAGQGTVLGASERGFLFISRRSGKQMHISWAAISLDQYVAFFQYYIAKRLQLDGTPTWDMFKRAGKISSINGRRDAAGECLLAGLLCDWYGNPDLAGKFLRLAVQYDPRSQARRFLAD